MCKNRSSNLIGRNYASTLQVDRSQATQKTADVTFEHCVKKFQKHSLLFRPHH